MNRLIDYPLDAVYVQPQRLDPVHDNLEKLAQYVRFLLTLDANGLSVIAGRVGAFGLVMQDSASRASTRVSTRRSPSI